MLIVVTGALYFADRDMKTADNYFRGFPALWNAAAFYLFLLKPSPWLAAASIVVLAVLTFVPFKFLHPFRVDTLARSHIRGACAVVCSGSRRAVCTISTRARGSRAVLSSSGSISSPSGLHRPMDARMIDLLLDPNAWAALVALDACSRSCSASTT